MVIGGGYATGRELASYFLPSGPRGGLYAMLLATAIWSTVCAVTFLFALRTSSRDYRTFFKNLLGRFWPVYEVAYLAALVIAWRPPRRPAPSPRRSSACRRSPAQPWR